MIGLRRHNLFAVLLAFTVFCNPSNTSSQATEFEREDKSSSRRIGCRGGAEMLLSSNRTLAPLNLVRASQSLIGASTSRIYSSVRTWCTTDDDMDPYVDMQFTSPILITMIATTGTVLIDGFGRLQNYYVTNFTLEYSPADNSSMLTFYTSTTDSAAPEYFAVSDFTSLIQFERPFLTQRIRIRPVEWFDSEGDAFSTQFVCQGVDIYGCLQSQVREPVTIRESADIKALSIVLPVVLITISCLAVLVVVLMCLLIRVKKQTTKSDGRHRADSGYSKLDRSLQQSMSPSLSDEHGFTPASTSSEPGPRYDDGTTRQSSIVKKVDNPIYGKDGSTNLNGQVHSTYALVGEPGYEPVGSSEVDPEVGELPRLLEHGNEMASSGLDTIAKVCDKDERAAAMINSSYEPVLFTENSAATSNGSIISEAEMAPRSDSMVDNSAYGNHELDGSISRPHDAQGKEEEKQYEAIVLLQRNSSYNYVANITTSRSDSQ